MNVSVCVQIAHTFFDAPGAAAATFTDVKEVEGVPLPVEGVPIPQSPWKPYVTVVFCGPADYKVPLSCPPPVWCSNSQCSRPALFYVVENGNQKAKNQGK